MPLQIESLSPTDKDDIHQALPIDPSPEQIHALAVRLLDRMVRDKTLVTAMENQIAWYVNRKREQLSRQEAAKNVGFYQFGVKHHSSSPEHYTYYNWKIHDYDFSRFCKHFGLSERSMLKVAAGEVDSHKGWCQGARPGNLGRRRAEYLREHNPHPAGIAISRVFQGQPASAQWTRVFLPAQWWTPPAD